MVKVDSKRDYYADLELNQSADSGDIKKAFRTLGELHINWDHCADY